jgi:hypothetical protein
MFSLRLMRLVVASGALMALPVPRAAMAMAAEIVRAYVLVEAKSGQFDAALQSLKSLGTCLAMVWSVRS